MPIEIELDARFRMITEQQGEHAFVLGMTLEDYPFEPGHQYRESWRLGWVTAQAVRAFEFGAGENPYPAADPLHGRWLFVWQALADRAAAQAALARERGF